MKLQEAVKKETIKVARGVSVLAILMLIVFAAAGKFSFPVLLGTIIGSGISVLNFLLLGITIQIATGGKA